MNTRKRSTRCITRKAVGFCILTTITLLLFGRRSQAASRGATPPSVEEQIRELRAEVVALRSELKSLREEIERPEGPLREVAYRNPTAQGVTEREHGYTGQSSADPRPKVVGEANQAANPTATPDQAEISSSVDILHSQVAELAQTKVESSSKWPVKIYGTILSTTFFNTHDVDWADTPLLVDARSPIFNTGSFSSSLRQSRIGLTIDGPSIGSYKSSGVFAMDFAGGMTDFQATPLFGLADIVYAYARFESSRTAFEAGQDEMILAPRNPTSLVAYAYPELYRAGNLYVRAPQLRVEHRLAGSEAGRQLKATAGLIAPIATYPTLDFPGSSVSNGWLRPAVQARLSWVSSPLASSESSGWEVGISGHYGRVALPSVDTSGNVVSSFSAASWAGALDFDAHHRYIGFAGEGYLGQNLQSLGGGIGQPGKTMGGYFEGRLRPTQRLQFNAGLGDDHLTKPIRILVPLNRNTAVFANTIFRFTPEVGVSLEYRHMITRPFDGTTRHNDNVDLGIAYSF